MIVQSAAICNLCKCYSLFQNLQTAIGIIENDATVCMGFDWFLHAVGSSTWYKIVPCLHSMILFITHHSYGFVSYPHSSKSVLNFNQKKNYNGVYIRPVSDVGSGWAKLDWIGDDATAIATTDAPATADTKVFSSFVEMQLATCTGSCSDRIDSCLLLMLGWIALIDRSVSMCVFRFALSVSDSIF